MRLNGKCERESEKSESWEFVIRWGWVGGVFCDLINVLLWEYLMSEVQERVTASLQQPGSLKQQQRCMRSLQYC